ncbi:unnamed protein product [Amoebophrya sp. A120]|nr:unnamed protein product [Amoebophrya sp. A120]|eukprot:GSA120T00022092001.1
MAASAAATATASTVPSIANVRFDVFCRFLENLHRSRKKKDKLETLWGFLRPVSDGDLWPGFRLMFPHADRHRGNYEMKENKLGKLVAEILNVPDREKKRLLGFKDAGLQEGFRCIPGDFSSVLFSVVEIRANYASAGLTVGDVNLVLDQLSVEYEDIEDIRVPGGGQAQGKAASIISGEVTEGKNDATTSPRGGKSTAATTSGRPPATSDASAELLQELQRARQNPALSTISASLTANMSRKVKEINTKQDKASHRVLLAAIRRMSPVEMKWLARFILKDTKLGFSVESVLSKFHKDAISLYQEMADLKMVLDRLRVGVNNTTESFTSSVNFLFQRIQPMLGGRLGIEHCDKVLFEKPKEQIAAAIAAAAEKEKEKEKSKQNLNKDAASNEELIQAESSGKKEDPLQGAQTEHPPQPGYFVETKLDGERMICHIDKSQGILQFFTRNGNDYTPRYGPQMKETILSCFGGDQGILDGEMLGFDEALQCFLPFGTNRNVSLDLSGKTHLCYMIFDVLMFKGRSHANASASSSSKDPHPASTTTTNKIYDFRSNSLQQRKQVLQTIIRPKRNWVELVEPRGPYFDAKEVEAELEQAVERREEGIMVKSIHSKYRFNSRKSGWWKLKPEYGNRYADHLDLVVIGGYFADTAGRRRGGTELVDNVSKFLLAVRVQGDVDNPGGEDDEDNPEQDAEQIADDGNEELQELLAAGRSDGENNKSLLVPNRLEKQNNALSSMEPKPREVVCFAKVATGYSKDELVQICDLMRPHVTRYEAANPPSWLQYKFPAHTRPDVVYKDLNDCNIVFEIEASEIMRSVDFELGYTMRFPRFVCLRNDKSFGDSMSFEELQQFLTAEAANQRFSLATGANRGKGEEGEAGTTDGQSRKRTRTTTVRVAKKPKIVGKVVAPAAMPMGDVVSDLQGLSSLATSGAAAIGDDEDPDTSSKTGAAAGGQATPAHLEKNYPHHIFRKLPGTTTSSSSPESIPQPGDVYRQLLPFVWQRQMQFEKDNPTIVSDLFKDTEICVLNRVTKSTLSRHFPTAEQQLLDHLLRKHGAKVVAQFSKNRTDFVLAGEIDLRVRNHFRMHYEQDVLHVLYVLEALMWWYGRKEKNESKLLSTAAFSSTAAGATTSTNGQQAEEQAQEKNQVLQVFPPRKRHYLLTSDSTKSKLATAFDQFGDSFTTEMTRLDWDQIVVDTTTSSTVSGGGAPDSNENHNAPTREYSDQELEKTIAELMA